ncbi:hypothetical protein [Streptomyces sp. CA-106131]|uniref:hypothetical protein n=1 Tax=Streptomyces sp. CA-106131 TaxID=3240045 RepID=UPI003D89F72F
MAGGQRLLEAACRPPRILYHQWWPGDVVVWDLTRCMLTAPRRGTSATAGCCGTCGWVLPVGEMSMGLAPVVVEQLFAALQEIAAERGLAVLLVEQHNQPALKYAQRGYVLAGGRVRTESTAAELLERWTEIEASYLGG